MTLTPDPDFVTILVSVTNTFAAFKKKYCSFFFKIKDGSLIMNLILLGKCDLSKVRSHPRWQLNGKAEKERRYIVKRRMRERNIMSKITKIMQIICYRKRKTAIGIKKKVIFALLTKMKILINIYMEIKFIQ